MVFKFLSLTLLFFKLSLLYVFGNIAVRIPCLKRLIIKQMDKKASIIMPVDNYWDTLFSWSLIQTLWKYGRYEINKKSKVGRVAPNPRVFLAEKGSTHVHLLDLVHNTRPLVVVFGSCTCPVLIAKLDQMFNVRQEFADVADFVMVYVQEAHPNDGWRMNNNYEIQSHSSMEARIEAAQTLRSLLPADIPIYADTIENEASVTYSGCPNRIVVIKENVLIYQNAPGPTSFNFDGVKRCLQKYLHQTV